MKEKRERQREGREGGTDHGAGGKEGERLDKERERYRVGNQAGRRKIGRRKGEWHFACLWEQEVRIEVPSERDKEEEL